MVLSYRDEFGIPTNGWSDIQTDRNEDKSIYRSPWRKMEPSNNVPLANSFGNRGGYFNSAKSGDIIITIYYRLWAILSNYGSNTSDLPKQISEIFTYDSFVEYTTGETTSNKFSLCIFNPLTAKVSTSTEFSNFKLGDYSFLNTNLDYIYESSFSSGGYTRYGDTTYNGKIYRTVPRKLYRYTDSVTDLPIESSCSGGPLAGSMTIEPVVIGQGYLPTCNAIFNLEIGDNEGYELGMPNTSFLYSGYLYGNGSVAMEVIYTLSNKVVS